MIKQGAFWIAGRSGRVQYFRIIAFRNVDIRLVRIRTEHFVKRPLIFKDVIFGDEQTKMVVVFRRFFNDFQIIHIKKQ